MRADRLLRLMMLLQDRRRWTAAALARRLEVSERTVFRDLDALSINGVPVVATRGPEGGIALQEGWRTELTGLTRKEVHALATVSPPRALAELQLLDPLRSALGKLSGALPAPQRPVIEYARQRLLVDPVPFFAAREEVPHLEALREAVWQDRRVRFAYRDFEGRRSTKVVEPYGLVVKADRWYLVGARGGEPVVFRGSRIERVRLLDEVFDRPPRFDLRTFWDQWSERFDQQRPKYEVTLRLDPAGARSLRQLRPRGEHALFEAASVAGRRTGTLTIDFEREMIALSQLCAVEGHVEVLEPAALRERLRSLGARLNAIYEARATRPPPPPAAPAAPARTSARSGTPSASAPPRGRSRPSSPAPAARR